MKVKWYFPADEKGQRGKTDLTRIYGGELDILVLGVFYHDSRWIRLRVATVLEPA